MTLDPSLSFAVQGVTRRFPGVLAVDSVDLGGYWVSFKPRSNQGSRFVELSIVNAAGRVSH